MKKLFLTLVLAFYGYYSYAQTWSGSTPGNIYYNSGNVGIGTTTPSANLQVGTSVGTMTSTPITLSLGGTFSSTHGNNPKLKVYDDGTSFWGLGISSSQLDYIVSGSTYDHTFYAGGTELMRIKGSGYVGIGTTSPSALLDLESPAVAVTSLAKSGLNAGFSQFQVQNDNGANAAFHHAVFGSTYSGTMFGVSLANSATLYADGNSISGILIGTKSATPITIGTNNAAAITVLSGGNVGIGTTNPGSYRLAVNGGIHSQSVNVDLTGWPDFVFKKEYQLLSLTEVKTYIDQNHHLPEMPSEQEVIKEGINLGEMNKLLTKKVEELTLYVIQQDKIENEQKAINQRQGSLLKSQQEQIDDLKTLVNKLMDKQNKDNRGKDR